MTNLDAKVSALIHASEGPAADSALDKGAGAPPSGPESGAESAAGDPASVAGSSPAAPGSSVAPTMAELMAEKLAKVREERQLRGAKTQAKQARNEAARIAAEAQADRQAAAAERQRWEALRSGSYLEGIKALGKDPAEAFAEMQREAIEAGTPEAQMKRIRAEMERQLGETIEPLKKTVEELRAERDDLLAKTAEQGFVKDFSGTVAATEYDALRDEYPDERLLSIASNLRDNPNAFYAEAARLKVRLTSPGEGFTMKDILNVLKSAHDEHETGKQSRRASRTASTPSEAAQQTASSPTVNGTAARRTAGDTTTIGNDLTTARAADGKFVPKGATAAQRIRERARRLGG